MVSMETINWNKKKLAALYKKLYECVHDEGMNDDETFMFEGHEFVIGYAKYLYEHVSRILNNQ